MSVNAPFINAQNVDKVEAYHYITDASDLGIPPGVVHQRLETSLGNKRPFVLSTYNNQCFSYTQDSGCITLDIYND